MSEKICIAKIGKTVGLKGELKLRIKSDFPEQFKNKSVFSLDDDNNITIEYYNEKNNNIKFYGYNDCQSAKMIVNKNLYTTLEETRKNCILTTNQFFWFDIIGLKVLENNRLLGVVKDIHRYSNIDYLEIITDANLVYMNLPKFFLIPYLQSHIKSVKLDDQSIFTINAFSILENS